MARRVSAYQIPIGTIQALDLVQGEDREYRLTFMDGANPVDFTGLTGCKLTIKNRANGTEIVARVGSVFGLATAGTLSFILGPADTQSAPPQTYDVDVSWTDASFTTVLLDQSPFRLAKAIGVPSDDLTTEPGSTPVVYGLNWRGLWNSGTSYLLNDAVQYHDFNGSNDPLSSFRCKVANTNVPPVDGSGNLSSDWEYVAERGDITGTPLVDNSQLLGLSDHRWAVGHFGPAGVFVHDDSTDTVHAELEISGGKATLTATAGLPVQIESGGNLGVYVDAAGKVGLGTTSPTEQLTVAGNQEFTGDAVIKTPDQTVASGHGHSLTLQPGQGGPAPGGIFATDGGILHLNSGKGGPGDSSHAPGNGGDIRILAGDMGDRTQPDPGSQDSYGGSVWIDAGWGSSQSATTLEEATHPGVIVIGAGIQGGGSGPCEEVRLGHPPLVTSGSQHGVPNRGGSDWGRVVMNGYLRNTNTYFNFDDYTLRCDWITGPHHIDCEPAPTGQTGVALTLLAGAGAAATSSVAGTTAGTLSVSGADGGAGSSNHAAGAGGDVQIVGGVPGADAGGGGASAGSITLLGSVATGTGTGSSIAITAGAGGSGGGNGGDVTIDVSAGGGGGLAGRIEIGTHQAPSLFELGHASTPLNVHASTVTMDGDVAFTGHLTTGILFKGGNNYGIQIDNDPSGAGGHTLAIYSANGVSGNQQGGTLQLNPGAGHGAGTNGNVVIGQPPLTAAAFIVHANALSFFEGGPAGQYTPAGKDYLADAFAALRSWGLIGGSPNPARVVPDGGSNTQVLTLVAGSPQWADATGGGGGGGGSLSGVGWSPVDATVSRGGVSAAGDNLTFGRTFQPVRTGTITGIRLWYYTDALTRNMKAVLWDHTGTVVATKTVALSSSGPQTITFDTPVTIGASDVYKTFTVSIYDTTFGSRWYITADATVDPSTPYHTGLIVWTNASSYGSGDAFPTNPSSAVHYPVEPILGS